MSHWTTSGGARLKAKQKRSFAKRAMQRARLFAPEKLIMHGGESSKNISLVPPERERKNQKYEAAKKRYSLGNPIRRGIVVDISRTDLLPTSSVSTSRRLRRTEHHANTTPHQSQHLRGRGLATRIIDRASEKHRGYGSNRERTTLHNANQRHSLPTHVHQHHEQGMMRRPPRDYYDDDMMQQQMAHEQPELGLPETFHAEGYYYDEAHPYNDTTTIPHYQGHHNEPLHDEDDATFHGLVARSTTTPQHLPPWEEPRSAIHHHARQPQLVPQGVPPSSNGGQHAQQWSPVGAFLADRDGLDETASFREEAAATTTPWRDDENWPSKRSRPLEQIRRSNVSRSNDLTLDTDKENEGRHAVGGGLWRFQQRRWNVSLDLHDKNEQSANFVEPLPPPSIDRHHHIGPARQSQGLARFQYGATAFPSGDQSFQEYDVESAHHLDRHSHQQVQRAHLTHHLSTHHLSSNQGIVRFQNPSKLQQIHFEKEWEDVPEHDGNDLCYEHGEEEEEAEAFGSQPWDLFDSSSPVFDCTSDVSTSTPGGLSYHPSDDAWSRGLSGNEPEPFPPLVDGSTVGPTSIVD